MIHLLRPYRYREVAKEIAEGLNSGDVVFEKKDSSEDLATFAYFALSVVHPERLSYVGGGALGAGVPVHLGKVNVKVELSPERFEALPGKVKEDLIQRLTELQERGVELDVTDARGHSFPTGHALAAWGSSARARG